MHDSAEGPDWSGTALVVRGREVLEELTAGSVAGVGGPPCSSGTRFQAGSISKLVVAAVVLALVERHVLALDRPVGRWLGRAPAAWGTTTLHHLLSQTSGIGHWGDVPGLTDFASAPPARDELADLVRRAPLVHAPGGRWTYSGPGFLVAALVVEAATGAAYGAAAADLVLAPAGLGSTTSGSFPLGAPDVAAGHRDGAAVPVHEGFTQIPGTGDLWTTVGDLVRLRRALGSGQVLVPGLAAQLWTPHAPLVRTTPADGRLVVTTAYGYGTFLGRVAGHPASINPGDNPGYQSLLAHLPGPDVDLAVLSNDDGPGVEAALRRFTSL